MGNGACSIAASLLQLGIMARQRGFLSVKDAASQLGLQPVTVRAHVARGNLKAQKLAGALWIEREELLRFGRERRLPGRRAARTARWEARQSAPVPLQAPCAEPSASLALSEDATPESRELAGTLCLAEASDCAPERKSF